VIREADQAPLHASRQDARSPDLGNGDARKWVIEAA